jgi:hypothetical protein
VKEYDFVTEELDEVSFILAETVSGTNTGTVVRHKKVILVLKCSRSLYLSIWMILMVIFVNAKSFTGY